MGGLEIYRIDDGGYLFGSVYHTDYLSLRDDGVRFLRLCNVQMAVLGEQPCPQNYEKIKNQ